MLIPKPRDPSFIRWGGLWKALGSKPFISQRGNKAWKDPVKQTEMGLGLESCLLILVCF